MTLDKTSSPNFASISMFEIEANLIQDLSDIPSVSPQICSWA